MYQHTFSEALKCIPLPTQILSFTWTLWLTDWIGLGTDAVKMRENMNTEGTQDFPHSYIMRHITFAFKSVQLFSSKRCHQALSEHTLSKLSLEQTAPPPDLQSLACRELCESSESSPDYAVLAAWRWSSWSYSWSSSWSSCSSNDLTKYKWPLWKCTWYCVKLNKCPDNITK